MLKYFLYQLLVYHNSFTNLFSVFNSGEYPSVFITHIEIEMNNDHT